MFHETLNLFFTRYLNPQMSSLMFSYRLEFSLMKETPRKTTYPVRINWFNGFIPREARVSRVTRELKRIVTRIDIRSDSCVTYNALRIAFSCVSGDAARYTRIASILIARCCKHATTMRVYLQFIAYITEMPRDTRFVFGRCIQIDSAQ